MTPSVQKARSQIASNAKGRGDDQDGDVESRAGGSVDTCAVSMLLLDPDEVDEGACSFHVSKDPKVAYRMAYRLRLYGFSV
jgi:hypothetical protein